MTRQLHSPSRPFSLALYLGIVFGLSWPFQFAYLVLGDTFRPILLLSMVAAGVANWIAGRYVFRDGFADAEWGWGRRAHYVMAIGLALLLWLAPVLVEGMQQGGAARVYDWSEMAQRFAASFLITLIPAFGEEFTWRGYLLPHLLERHTVRRALLLHGLITWVWHLPFVVAMGMAFGGDPMISVPLVLAVSLIPAVMHAVVFAWLWAISGSLLVVTVYHAAFDEVRDTLQDAVGFGPLAENWQSVVLTILGGLVLWRATDRFRGRRARTVPASGEVVPEGP